MPKLAQRQALVSIEGIAGWWATKSGGNISADVSQVWDGGTDTPESIAGMPAAENVTCSRPFDRDRDLPILAALRSEVGRKRRTITVQYTDENLFPIGSPTVYAEALLVSLNEPEFDASGSDAMTIEVEYNVTKYA